MLYEYIPIHLGLGIASIISFIFLSLSYILSTAKFQMTFEKLSTYECGFQPFEDSRHLFNISFYLIGILFVVFDLEIVFLFPWCVTIPFLNFFGFKIFLLFMIILIIDFSMNYGKELLILPQTVKLYSSSILLLRCFSGNLLHSLKLVFDFNLRKTDIIVEFNNLEKFWTFFIILKNSLLFNYIQLNDITCVDNLNLLAKSDVTKIKNRFSLVYIFTNVKYASQIIVKLTIDYPQTIPSIFNLFKGAAWLEREIFDLFGVIFKDHPDLRRILTDYGVLHHPLLKDFPLSGYVELKYNGVHKCIEYQTVQLMQEYRHFVFESPWNQYSIFTKVNLNSKLKD